MTVFQLNCALETISFFNKEIKTNKIVIVQIFEIEYGLDNVHPAILLFTVVRNKLILIRVNKNALH